MKQLCETMEEELEVAYYDRFTTLEVEAGGLRGGYRSVQPGDCVVAFSRKSIFAIKQAGSHLPYHARRFLRGTVSLDGE